MGWRSSFGPGPLALAPGEVVEMTSDRSDAFRIRRLAAQGAPPGGGASPFRFRRPVPRDAPPPQASADRFPVAGPLVPWPQDAAQVWDDLAAAEPDAAAMRRNRIVAGAGDAPAAAVFDILRTRLAQTLEDNGWRRIAITAPTRGCGATTVAANLALSFARRPGSRAVLVDLELRRPGLAAALGIPAPGPLEAVLRGEAPMLGHLRRIGANLAVALSDSPAGDAAALLQDPQTADVLAAMIAALEPDVVLYDLPPALARDDVLAFLPQIDGVLLVADGAQTLPRDITACERMLDGRAKLFGVVLNRAEDGGLRRYARDAG